MSQQQTESRCHIQGKDKQHIRTRRRRRSPHLTINGSTIPYRNKKQIYSLCIFNLCSKCSTTNARSKILELQDNINDINFKY